jgi:hypothetical protein
MQLRAIERWAALLREDRGDTLWNDHDRAEVDLAYDALYGIVERGRDG